MTINEWLFTECVLSEWFGAVALVGLGFWLFVVTPLFVIFIAKEIGLIDLLKGGYDGKGRP